MTIDKPEKIRHLPTQKRRVLLSLEGNGCQIYYKTILNFIVHTHILQEYFWQQWQQIEFQQLPKQLHKLNVYLH